MLKLFRRRIWSFLFLLTLIAPIGFVLPVHAQEGGITGTDPEPTEPDVVIEAILALLLIA
jgi:hypothetical protein